MKNFHKFVNPGQLATDDILTSHYSKVHKTFDLTNHLPMLNVQQHQ